MNNLIWNEGEFAYFRDDFGRLWRRKLDLVHWKYYPLEIIQEQDKDNLKD